MGLVHIYCGDGKGKTSAAIGLAVRAAGRGTLCVIARFLKTDDSGEVAALRKIPGIRVLPCERSFGFYSRMDEGARREAAGYYQELFEAAVSEFGAAALQAERGIGEPGQEKEDRQPAGLLVLDEILAAVNFGMIPEERLLSFLGARPEGLEVVLTGRDPSRRLLSAADYVSEIRKISHPFDRGILARKGIEY